VLYHLFGEIGIRTKMLVGRLVIKDDNLVIHGDTEVSMPLNTLRSVEQLRLHRVGTMLKVSHHVGGAFYVTVIRFNLFGIFAVVNYFATVRLKRQLEAAMSKQIR